MPDGLKAVSFHVFDFVLTDDDMAGIAALDKKVIFFLPHRSEHDGRVLQDGGRTKKQQECTRKKKNWQIHYL